MSYTYVAVFSLSRNSVLLGDTLAGPGGCGSLEGGPIVSGAVEQAV